ncbi:GT2 family glycosyltransferase [Algoriphagus iocasae]|uniref:GT2 family glycosyltransferase n=1 Tax=Algoriphagus iocasae TaxID=1836499 RepID=A0A841MQ80_9BACT|nr:glycosyltransferase [Algoriphagus iocasae]MBB6327749.1 GT2 family glycosyltransferase [Algoriphagus iocasae]
MSYFISVIIPLYKDWERLGFCLQALENQDSPEVEFEVIIVNNDPNDTKELDINYSFPIRYLKEIIPGSYAARNKGISVAKGDAYIFTDSDCIPSSNWIKTSVFLLNSYSTDIFAGSIKLFSEIDNRYVRFEKVFAFPNEKYVNDENFGVTANLLVRKSVLEKIGGFNTKLLTGGDSEFCNRAVKEGFKIAYFNDLQVSHPARSSWKELRVKAKRFGGRLPSGGNKTIIFLKLIGKFRIRLKDIQEISKIQDNGFFQKLDYFLIKQNLRWVEAKESIFVFLGKKAGRK